MKYLQMRNNRYYYRRRIPTSLHDIATIKVIFRPLSTEKKLALEIDGVLYFDLKYKTLRLKLQGSYRLIPVHYLSKKPAI